MCPCALDKSSLSIGRVNGDKFASKAWNHVDDSPGCGYDTYTGFLPEPWSCACAKSITFIAGVICIYLIQ